MAEDEKKDLDIVGTCKDVLLALLSDRAPEEVLQTLTATGIPADDAQTLINVTVACAQEVSPVIEGKAVQWQAVDALVKQGVEKPLAESLVKMVITVMNSQQAGGAAAATAGAAAAAGKTAVVNEASVKVLLRLALVVDADLLRGVPVENIAQAIDNIPDVEDYADVAGRAVEFVDNVRLARAACNLAQTGTPLQQVITELGLDKKQPYVPIMAVFFNKLLTSSAPGPLNN